MARGTPSIGCLKSYLSDVTEVLSTILLDKCCHSVGLYAVEGLGTRLANRLEIWQLMQTQLCLRFGRFNDAA